AFRCDSRTFEVIVNPNVLIRFFGSLAGFRTKLDKPRMVSEANVPGNIKTNILLFIGRFTVRQLNLIKAERRWLVQGHRAKYIGLSCSPESHTFKRIFRNENSTAEAIIFFFGSFAGAETVFDQLFTQPELPTETIRRHLLTSRTG